MLNYRQAWPSDCCRGNKITQQRQGWEKRWRSETAEIMHNHEAKMKSAGELELLRNKTRKLLP